MALEMDPDSKTIQSKVAIELAHQLTMTFKKNADQGEQNGDDDDEAIV